MRGMAGSWLNLTLQASCGKFYDSVGNGRDRLRRRVDRLLGANMLRSKLRPILGFRVRYLNQWTGSPDDSRSHWRNANALHLGPAGVFGIRRDSAARLLTRFGNCEHELCN